MQNTKIKIFKRRNTKCFVRENISKISYLGRSLIKRVLVFFQYKVVTEFGIRFMNEFDFLSNVSYRAYFEMIWGETYEKDCFLKK